MINQFTKLCFLIAFYIFSNCIFPQTKIQNGLVRELNSDKKAIASVQIIFTDAKATDSDGAGKFQLVFQNKKAGDIIIKEKIQKNGYELVNEKDFDIVKISNTDELGVDIIMAKEGTVEAAKREYYDVSNQELLASFNKEKQNLQEQLKEAEISQKDYESKLTTLQEDYDNQKKRLDELAEMFARVNFDDVSELYREALELFKTGKIDEAIEKLESVDLIGRTNRRLQIRGENEKGIKEDIKLIQLNAQLYKVNLENHKAEALIDQLFLLDSTRLDILQECADFYRENHRYEKAIRLYSKIIDHPDAEDWQKADAYLLLGSLYNYIGSLDKALSSFFKSENFCLQRLKDNPSQLIYRKKLLVTFIGLGDTYMSLGNLKNALFYYEKTTRLNEEIYESDSSNTKLKLGLAASYQRLGKVFEQDSLNKALRIYEKSILLLLELNKLSPNDTTYKMALAVSYQNSGEVCTQLGKPNEAVSFFNEYNKLVKELYEADTNDVFYKQMLAISYIYLGDTQFSLGNLKMSLICFENSNRLLIELYQDYPTNVKIKSRLAISYSKLGLTYGSLDSLFKTLGFYYKCNTLEKELYKVDTNNVFHKYYLASSYSDLGDVHTSLGNLDSALVFYKEFNHLIKELYETYPQRNYKNSLATSYQVLGSTYKSLGDSYQALEFYEEYNKLERELYEAESDNVKIKFNFALSYAHLGDIYRSLDTLSKALEFYSEENRLVKELYKIDTNNVFYKYELAQSYDKIGMTYFLLNNFNNALSQYKICNHLAIELYERNPDDFQNKKLLAISYLRLGAIYEVALNPTKAKNNFLLSKKLLNELISNSPQSVDLKSYIDTIESIISE